MTTYFFQWPLKSQGSGQRRIRGSGSERNIYESKTLAFCYKTFFFYFVSLAPVLMVLLANQNRKVGESSSPEDETAGEVGAQDAEIGQQEHASE